MSTKPIVADNHFPGAFELRSLRIFFVSACCLVSFADSGHYRKLMLDLNPLTLEGLRVRDMRTVVGDREGGAGDGNSLPVASVDLSRSRINREQRPPGSTLDTLERTEIRDVLPLEEPPAVFGCWANFEPVRRRATELLPEKRFGL